MKKIINKFLFLLSLTILLTKTLHADTWYFRENAGIIGEVNDKIILDVSQTNWFTPENVWQLSVFDPNILLRIKGENFLGFNPAYAIYRSTFSGELTREFSPGVFVDNEFKIGKKFKFQTTLATYYRSIEKSDDWALAKLEVSLDLLKYKCLKFYVNNKFYYNSYNTHRYDFNRLTFGCFCHVNKHFLTNFYYIFQKRKFAVGASWSDSHVFGLDLKFKIWNPKVLRKEKRPLEQVPEVFY